MEHFTKADRPKQDLDKLIAIIEGVVGVPQSALSLTKQKYWNGMCSYVHGGYLQAVRRISVTDIGSNYTDDEQIGVLSFANFCLLLASVELCALGNRDDLAVSIAHLSIEL